SGQDNHTYGFYSVAIDNVGNRETPPTAAEATTLVRTQVANSTTLSSDHPSGSNFGQAVTFTATVSPSAGTAGTPTGSVQFKLDGFSFSSPVTVSGGMASIQTSSLSAGPHQITAVYTSDTTNFLASSSAQPLTQTVNPAPLTVTADYQSRPY